MNDLDRFSILLSGTDVKKSLELAGLSERCGYRRVWLAETGGVEAASLGAVISQTTSLEVGTAIVSVFGRTPAMMAMMAGTWSDLGGDDRAVHLGIGAGGQSIVENWHGQQFDKPATATKDTLRILRQALAGEKTSYEGKARYSSGFRLLTGPAPMVKIYIGGMGPAMIAMAAEEADGLILTWLSPRVLHSFSAEFADAVIAAGREPSAVRLVARAYVAVTETLLAAREEVRKELVEYVVSPPYGRYFGSVGFETEVSEVNAAFQARDRTAAVAAVSDRLLDEVFIGGRSGGEVADRLAAYLAEGADEVMIQPVEISRGGNPRRTIEEVAIVLGNA